MKETKIYVMKETAIHPNMYLKIQPSKKTKKKTENYAFIVVYN